jgi:hypothetical protein
MTEAGLDGEARTALAAMDRERLLACGAHRYLVFMAGLRLAMARDPAALEYF